MSRSSGKKRIPPKWSEILAMLKLHRWPLTCSQIADALNPGWRDESKAKRSSTTGSIGRALSGLSGRNLAWSPLKGFWTDVNPETCDRLFGWVGVLGDGLVSGEDVDHWLAMTVIQKFVARWRLTSSDLDGREKSEFDFIPPFEISNESRHSAVVQAAIHVMGGVDVKKQRECNIVDNVIRTAILTSPSLDTDEFRSLIPLIVDYVRRSAGCPGMGGGSLLTADEILRASMRRGCWMDLSFISEMEGTSW